MIKRIVLFQLIIFFHIFSVSTLAENVYIFFPSNITFQTMEDTLSGLMKGVNVTVFGKYNEFITKVKSELPDAVITKTLLIKEQLDNYEILLRGEHKGKTEDNYVILSAGELFNADSVNSETVIGVLDILGRAGMNNLLKSIFPVQPKLKKVSKPEDLISLLSFDMIAGIMVEEIFVDYFKSTSKLQFTVTPLKNSTTGIIALAVKKGGSAQKTIRYLKSNKKICELFLIDEWK